MLVGFACALTPTAAFNGTPTSGTAYVTVSFTDQSIGSPTGWAWYFGEENYMFPWTHITASAGWTGRFSHSSVVMPDGSIVLMGGDDDLGYKNDTWRSMDHGATWILVNASSGWPARGYHSSVVMPDRSIVLMGGAYSFVRMNDVWRSTDNGSTWALVNASAGWSPREGQSSVVMPDGSIVLMGGTDINGFKNDTWRSMDNGATWKLVNASSGWSRRNGHSSVVMPDGSIVLMGGYFYNDTWRSADNGTTWQQMNASSGWTGRFIHSSVTMPDGSIILMGGADYNGYKNDTWQSMDYGASWNLVNATSSWSERGAHSSVSMPDGSIVIMGGGSMNDTWRFMPVGSSMQNPVHTYIKPGTYQVTLQVYNADGYNSTRKTGYITVHARPVPNFIGTPRSGTAPLTVTFTDSSTNSPTSWNWSFGDGATSESRNPVHTYTTAGTYNVCLRVTFVGGSTIKISPDYITIWDNEGSDSSGDSPPALTSNPSTTPTGTTITEMVNVGGGSAVNRVEVTGTNLGKNLVVTAFPRNNLPSDIAITQTTVYQYISVVLSTIPGVIDQAILEFNVPQSWLTEHGLTAGDIVMMHYDNGQWVELDTQYVSQKNGNVFYHATTSGFSYFAIVYRKDGTDMGTEPPVPTTVPTLVTVLKAPVQEAPTTVQVTKEKTLAVPPAPVTQPSGGIPMTTIIIGTTGAIATIIGTVLIRRWWIRKQNPTLFRKNNRY